MSTLSARILKEALDNCTLTLEDLRNFLPNTRNSQDAFKEISKWNTITNVSVLPENRDFRFCHLLLKNFRKFGNLANNTYYGLKFIKRPELNEEGKADEKGNEGNEGVEIVEKLIDFLTLLGDNGIGKSSLVDSLEYMFTGNIGEAKFRQIPASLYIRNRSGEKNVKLYTNNGIEFVLNDKNCKSFSQEYDVSNFFFSENSILKFAEYTQRNVDGANNWFPFFCHILGLGALFDACSNGGILDQIKEEVGNTRSSISSEDVGKIRKKLQYLLRDGCIKTGEKQKSYLNRMLSKLLSIKQDIQKKKISNTKDLLFFNNRDFDYKKDFYFIEEFYEFYQKIKNPKSETAQSNPSSKKLLPDEKKNEADNCQKFFDIIDECIIHIQNIIKYGTGIVPIDDIKNDMQLLIEKEKSGIVAERHRTIEELNQIYEKIDQLKTEIQQLIHQTIIKYVDEDLVEAVKTVFDKTFITKDEETLNFEISELAERKKITISVKDEPVHKYFNTFRYRLFCLTLQGVLNIKLMEEENFSFPFVMDDIFYANDYKNKRELFRYFIQIRDYADKTLKGGKALQIVFFTHDEQIVSCFSTKFKGEKDCLVRLTQPEFAIKFGKNEVCTKDKCERYHNLYFKLYD